MKKKRITSKIIVFIVCLSIVLTLFVLPCFASSGYKPFYGSSDISYRGIPFDVHGLWKFENRDPDASSYQNIIQMDTYSNDVLSFTYTEGYGYIPDSVIGLANSMVETAYNNPVGMYNYQELTSEQYLLGYPYLSDNNLNSIDSYHMFFASNIVTGLTMGLDETLYYYNTFSEEEYYDTHYGCYALRLSCDDILSTDFIGWNNLNLQNYYIYNFKDNDTINYRCYIDYDIYYFDNGELKTRSFSGSTSVLSAANIDYTQTSLQSNLNALDNAYEDYFEFNIRYFELPLNSLLYDSILYNSQPLDIGYITDLDITVSIEDPIVGNNPYLSEARDLYTYYTILGISGHGIDINQDIVNDSLNGFYDNYSLVENHVTEYVSLEEFNLIGWLGNTLGSIMDIEIIGPITLGSILYVAMGAGFIFLILRFFAGG